MNIQKREILKTVATLGLYGYLRTKSRLEENHLKGKIVFSEQIVGLMLAIPVIALFTIGSSITQGVYEIFDFSAQLKAWLDVDNTYPEAPPLIDAILWIPHAYVFFIFLHLYLGVAYFQHSEGIRKEDRWKVLLFGFYALDWDPSSHLKTIKSENDQCLGDNEADAE